MELIKKYFKKLSENQYIQLAQLAHLYADWNEKINVISRKDMDNFYERHVLHSMAIAKTINFKPGSEILDIGTGGGFPGIPLAILFPKSNFTLIDSIGKKIKVVNGVVESLGLKNAKGIHSNSIHIKEKYDFVVSRAVTAFPKFVNLVKGKINDEHINSLQNGIIYLKGGDLDAELKKYRKKTALYPIQNYFEEEFFETKYVVYYPM